MAPKKIAYLTLSFAISPAISIFIGGVLLANFGLISCFYASLGYGVILLGLTKGLPETLPNKDYQALAIHRLVSSYKAQFGNLNVLMSGILMGANASFIYIFAALAPFIAMGHFGLSPVEYGSYNMLPPVGLACGYIASANLATRFTTKQLILTGLIVLLVGIFAMVVINSLALESAFISLFIPCLVGFLGSALIHPNAVVFGMNSSANKANASAVMNCLNLTSATLAIILLKYCRIDLDTLLYSNVGLCLLEVLIFILVIRRSK